MPAPFSGHCRRLAARPPSTLLTSTFTPSQTAMHAAIHASMHAAMHAPIHTAIHAPIHTFTMHIASRTI